MPALTSGCGVAQAALLCLDLGAGALTWSKPEGEDAAIWLFPCLPVCAGCEAAVERLLASTTAELSLKKLVSI